MRRIFVLFIAFLTLSTDLVEFSYYQKDDTQAKIKSAYIYQFTKNFEWPNIKGNFIIDVVGEAPGLVAALNKNIANKLVGEQVIEIRNHQSVKEIEAAHIIYITPDKSSLLADVVSKFKGRGTLIITEKAGAAKVGATINFVISDNQQKFELNKAAATKAGLIMGAKIEKQAIAIFN